MSKIQLFSASGKLIGKYRLRAIEKRVARLQARWLEPGVSAELVHHSDDDACSGVASTERGYDRARVSGNWRVIQPAATNFRVLCAQLVMPR